MDDPFFEDEVPEESPAQDVLRRIQEEESSVLPDDEILADLWEELRQVSPDTYREMMGEWH